MADPDKGKKEDEPKGKEETNDKERKAPPVATNPYPTVGGPTANPGSTGTSKSGLNSYYNITGPDKLSKILVDFLNQYAVKYGLGKIVGPGAGKYTIKERRDQLLEMGIKYGEAFYGSKGLGGFLRNWDTSLGGKKNDTYTAHSVAYAFASLMENAQSAVNAKGKQEYGNFSSWLMATAPPQVTTYLGTGGGTGSGDAGAFATQVLNDLGAPVTTNNLTKIINWMGHEESSSTWAANGNPLNSGQTTGLQGEQLQIIGTSSAGFPIYASLTVAAEATAADLLSGAGGPGYGKAVQNLRTDGSIGNFSAAIVSSGWAGGHYGGNPQALTTPANGITVTSTPAGTPWTGGGGTAGALTIAQIAAQAAAATTKQIAQAIFGAENAAYLKNATQTKDYSSYETVHNELYRWGLQDLARWAWDKSQKGEDAIQITLDLRATPQYAARFPGLVAREKSGLPPITEEQYITYQNEMMSYANTVALPKGFITPKEVGVLIANDVSPVEFSQRLQALQTVALKADPTVRAEFAKWFGVHGGLGALTAYFADPHRATGILQEQVNQAMIGAEAINSGFGSLSKAHALQLAQDEASGKIALGTSRTDLDKAANQLYLTAGAPGSVAPRVSRAALLGEYIPGYAGTNERNAQAQVRNAESARESELAGGGGFAATARGVRGAGGASTEGTPV